MTASIVPQPESLLLTVQETARELRMSVGYVKAKIRSHELPARKLGTRTRIERRALEAFIQAQPTVPNFVTTLPVHGQTLEQPAKCQPVEMMMDGRR